MGVRVVLACLVIAVAVLVGLYIHNHPLPSDLHKHWKVRSTMMKFTFMGLLTRAGSSLGFGSRIHLLQKLMDKQVAAMPAPIHPNVKETRTELAGVPVIIFDPDGRETNSPAIVFYHGGAWVFLSADTYRRFCQNLAKATNYLVVSVDYRRAPDNPFPIPIEDCHKVTKYFLENAKQYGVDSDRVAIAGDSAGGNMAGGISLLFRDEQLRSKGTKVPKAQVLIYPILQLVDFNTPSYQNNSGILIFKRGTAEYLQFYAFGEREQNEDQNQAILAGRHISRQNIQKHKWKLDHKILPAENFQQTYEAPVHNHDKSSYEELERIVLNPMVSPLLADNFDNLPSTLVITMQYDVLRDDGYLYAHHLRQAGVHVVHKNYITGWHGACSFDTELPCYEDIAQFLHEVL